MLGDVLTERRHEVGALTGVEQEGRPQLHALQAQLLQPRPLPLGPRRVGEVGVGGTAPRRERLAERGDAVRGAAGRGQGVLEAVDVHRLARQPQHITGPLGDQQPRRGTGRPVGFDGTAQRGDEGAQGAQGTGSRLGPQVGDERVGGQQPPLRGDQAREHLAVPGPAQVDRAAVVVPRLYGTQYINPHAPILGARTGLRRTVLIGC
ncbi:hypothetical protein SALBM135S_04840 [Streptomyces alboniger]